MFSFNHTRGMLLARAALGLSLGQVAAAENWPTFRGDGARGISENKNLPLEWDAKQNKNIEWKTAVPGLGWSNPVVHSGRIYLTSAVSDGECSKYGERIGQRGIGAPLTATSRA